MLGGSNYETERTQANHVSHLIDRCSYRCIGPMDWNTLIYSNWIFHLTANWFYSISFGDVCERALDTKPIAEVLIQF